MIFLTQCILLCVYIQQFLWDLSVYVVSYASSQIYDSMVWRVHMNKDVCKHLQFLMHTHLFTYIPTKHFRWSALTWNCCFNNNYVSMKICWYWPAWTFQLFLSYLFRSLKFLVLDKGVKQKGLNRNQNCIVVRNISSIEH